MILLQIGVVDGIFTRIYTAESATSGLGSFSADLLQVSRCVKKATSRSLVVIDEFGKGTDSTYGLALLAAILNQWLQSPSACPHVVLSTHFLNLKAHLVESPLLRHFAMKVVEMDEQLAYLYEVDDGVATCSRALQIWSDVGASDALVQRAAEVSDLVRRGLPVSRLSVPDSNAEFQRNYGVLKHFCRLDLQRVDLGQLKTQLFGCEESIEKSMEESL